MKRLVCAALLAGCTPGSGEADDLCAAERLADDLVPDVWTIGVEVPLDEGGAVHVQARWPDRSATTATRWPVTVVIHGAWEPQGTPVTDGIPHLEPRLGFVDLHLDLPGAGTEGGNDRRGASARASVAAVLRWAAGDALDLGGCTLEARIPGADPDALYILGASNGGNLAVATLADAALDLPPVAGLVTWETPAGPQFSNVELGKNPSVYSPGSCALVPDAGIVCDTPDETLRSGTVDGEDVLCFDQTADEHCGTGDVLIWGVRDDTTGTTYVSPTLAAAASARGVALPGWADEDMAHAWWAERDAARLAEALVANQPELPILVLASEQDHVQSLVDHPHVFGFGEALQAAGARWTRLNPGKAYLPAFDPDNAANMELSLETTRGALLPEEVEGPLPALYTAAIAELDTHRTDGDW